MDAIKKGLKLKMMKLLEKEFMGKGESRGFQFTQISMTDKAFLYEVNTGSSLYYEVFKKVVNKRYGNISYPTSKGFGIWAWTYPCLFIAMKKFVELSS